MEPTIRRWKKMENFKAFFPLLKGMLRDIYGSEEEGLRIYEERYNAISYYRNYRAKPNSFLLVAEADGNPVGFLYGRRFSRYSYLYDIFVRNDLRGKGIGRKLVEEFERLSGLPIRCDTHRKVLPFFLKLGFKVLKEYEENNIRWFTVEKSCKIPRST